MRMCDAASILGAGEVGGERFVPLRVAQSQAETARSPDGKTRPSRAPQTWAAAVLRNRFPEVADLDCLVRQSHWTNLTGNRELNTEYCLLEIHPGGDHYQNHCQNPQGRIAHSSFLGHNLNLNPAECFRKPCFR